MTAIRQSDLVIGVEIGRMKKNSKLKIPSRFCQAMCRRSASTSLVVSYSQQRGCLVVQDVLTTEKYFDNSRDRAMPIGEARAVCTLSHLVSVDMGDRIRIPDLLRKVAEMADHVVILGTGDGFELWNPSRLYQQSEQDPYFRSVIEYQVGKGHLPRSVIEADPEPDAETLSTQAVNDNGPAAEAAQTDEAIANAQEAQVEAGAEAGVEAGAEDLGEAAMERDCEVASAIEMPNCRGKKLVYRRGLDVVFGYSKRIRYISPGMVANDTEWVIVVEPPMLLGDPAIKPMWRVRRPEEDTDPVSHSFPTDWIDHQMWPGYDPHDAETLGLPEALQAHYQAHRAEIRKHAQKRRKFDSFFLFSRLPLLTAGAVNDVVTDIEQGEDKVIAIG